MTGVKWTAILKDMNIQKNSIELFLRKNKEGKSQSYYLVIFFIKNIKGKYKLKY